MSKNAKEKAQQLIEDIKKAIEHNPIFIFPQHKFAYNYIFNEDVVKNSPLYCVSITPEKEQEHSTIDLCKLLDQNDKIEMYNISVANDQRIVKIVVNDETTLTALALSNNDFAMAGLI